MERVISILVAAGIGFGVSEANEVIDANPFLTIGVGLVILVITTGYKDIGRATSRVYYRCKVGSVTLEDWRKAMEKRHMEAMKATLDDADYLAWVKYERWANAKWWQIHRYFER